MEIGPSIRLKVHFLAAFLFLFGHAGWGAGRWGDVLMYIPWAVFIVGTANIYNFMDGINGIAAITGVVGFGLLGTFHAWYEVDGTAFWYWSLAAACAGFLPLNLPRARVFMGDVGSILLGLTFATGVVAASHSVQDFLCVASFLFPFYADELTTMYLRLRIGENLTVAHRRHMYQVLVNEMKYPHWKIAVVYGVMQAVVGVVSLLLVPRGWAPLAVFLLFCLAVFVVAQAYIRKAVAGNSKRSLWPSKLRT
jgi:Fuc2NAc and GlcNAc transferase